MKKILLLLLCVSFGMLNVFAEDIYYTNANGIEMSEDEYKFYGEVFWDGYQDNVTYEQHIKYMSVYGNEISKSTYYDVSTSRGNTHETPAKKLTLAKSCSSSTCFLVTTLQWKKFPNVKSNDVIGALLYGNLTLTSVPQTTFYYSGGYINEYTVKYSNNGWGFTVPLLNSTSYYMITQEFDLTGNGTVYASYQHATSSISVSTSQMFNCSLSGYGNVFSFYSTAVGKFDGMGGVDQTISL